MSLSSNGKALDLTIPQKKAAKKVWSDLENLELDEYEIRIFELHCTRCDGKAYTSGYKILAEGEWKGYKKEALCSDCEVHDELMESSEYYKDRLNQNLTERCWFPPKGLEDANLKNYNASNTVTQNALYGCVQYVKGFTKESRSKQHNLLLMGNPGTGKSHLSYAIAKYLRGKNIGSVGFMTTGKALALIKETYQNGASRSENDILLDIEKLDFLVLDDLGAEANNTDEFSWSKTKIFDIVNGRLGKPTVYTTNFSDRNLGQVVGERVSSRLQDKTKYINLFTEDYRKNFILN